MAEVNCSARYNFVSMWSAVSGCVALQWSLGACAA